MFNIFILVINAILLSGCFVFRHKKDPNEQTKIIYENDENRLQILEAITIKNLKKY